MPEKEIRQLAAVMFTDIAGYTAMVQDDEAAALEKVARYRQVLQECTEKYGGQVIAFYGDGSLSIYPSASNAVRCGIDMQAGYRESSPVSVPVRIGLHLGDIVLKDDTVYGDGVNVASRIEAQGVPGAILVSGKIQRELKNQADINTEFLGAYDLKNVQERIDVYAVTNEGLVVPTKPKQPRFSRKQVQRLAAGVILLFLGAFFLANSGVLPFLNIGKEETPILQERVAVIFEDFIRTDELAHIPVMASEVLIDDLREIPDTKVISYESAMRQKEEFGKSGESNVAIASADYASFARRTGAVNYLRGMVVKVGDSLDFRASLFDLRNPDDVIKQFKRVRVSADNPSLGIQQLGTEILGFWASREDKVMTVPSIDAYKAYLNARRAWTEDDERAYAYLQRSIAIDSSFMDPYFMMMDYWINWPRCNRDSAQAVVDLVRNRFEDLTSRHKNLLNYYQADLDGDKLLAVQLFENELAIDPLDHFKNTTALILAETYAHDARKAIEYLQQIPTDSMDFDECAYCLDRLNHAVDAYVSLGELRKAESLVRNMPLAGETEYRSKVKVNAGLRDTTTLNELTREWINRKQSAWFANYHIAERFRILGEPEYEQIYLARATDALTSNADWQTMLTRYMMSDFAGAHEIITKIVADLPTNPQVLYYYGLINARLGNAQAARQAIQNLENAIADCGEGENLYYQAGIYAHLGEEDNAINKLRESLESTMGYYYWAFGNDHNLVVLNDNPAYQALLNPVNN